MVSKLSEFVSESENFEPQGRAAAVACQWGCFRVFILGDYAHYFLDDIFIGVMAILHALRGGSEIDCFSWYGEQLPGPLKGCIVMETELST